MAFLTYDEVKARLQKFIHKPGRWDRKHSRAHICTNHWLWIHPRPSAGHARVWGRRRDRSWEPGQHGTGSQPQCFDCGPQSDVSVLGQLTGSPSVSQAGIAQYEVKTKVCLTVWSWFSCLIATLMVPVHREGARIHYSCSCSIFNISYCGATRDSLHMHPASFDCCSWSEFKISVPAHPEPN